MEQFKNNNEPIFSFHSFGIIWIFIFLTVLSLGVGNWAQKEHDRRIEKQKQEQIDNEQEIKK
jgi:hypothetical protein